MKSHIEISTWYAREYVKASKTEKGRILDQVVEATGWSRDNARRRLTATAKQTSSQDLPVSTVRRKPRTPKYSRETRNVLRTVWAASGRQCGKYLAASLVTQLDALERHGELALDGSGRLDPDHRYCLDVRTQLLSMSAASIDRYLAPAKANDRVNGVTTSKPSPLLRSSISMRTGTGDVKNEPGFFEGEIVAHCGFTLSGEFARTANLTDQHTGWVVTRTIANSDIVDALDAGVDQIPFAVTQLDFTNGSEFLSKNVTGWASSRGIIFTQVRLHTDHDLATLKSQNNHLVRRYGLHYRYDTDAERRVLNQLWQLVNDRLNYLTPTKRPIGFGSDCSGHRSRVYDEPAIPLDRLLAARVLARAQETELLAYRDTLNPAKLARDIAGLQSRLTLLAKQKTEALSRTACPRASRS